MNAWIKRSTDAAVRHPHLFDCTLTAVLLVAGLTWGLLEFRYLGQRPGDVLPPVRPTPVVVAAIVAIITPLAWRRRAPLTVLTLVAAAQVTASALLRYENEITVLAVLVAVYSASAYGAKPWRTRLSAIALAALVAAMDYRVALSLPDMNSGLTMSIALAAYSVHLLVFGGGVYAVGRNMRIRISREAELKIRTAQLAAEQETNTRRAVLEERVRVARELHDVIAHHVSLMGIQAAAGRRVLTTRPDQSAKALVSIEESSRQAVGELQRMLGFLRQDDEVDTLAPLPSLRHLDHLVTQMFDAKLTVDVHCEGDLQPLPISVDLSAYRIVQEALTNTLKHAKATTASVTLRYRHAVFEVDVIDNGVGSGTAPNLDNGRQRHGLIGMRERVSLHRGQFEAGPRLGGGFGVWASFPLREGS
ncbi:MAG: sensor histidine kinase [Pseudonocardiaceae bacterium]